MTDPVDRHGRVLDWPRLKRAARRKENWAQLTTFCLIGGSGYLVNLVVFALCVKGLRLDIHAAAVVAFLCAVCNNFVWNRRWTFRERGADASREAMKFFVVSTAAFLLSLSILTTLVSIANVPAVAAQLISIAVATPLSFAGNKLWTFRQGWAARPLTEGTQMDPAGSG